MLCQNCNKNEATVKYTEIINGEKREVMLCEECYDAFSPKIDSILKRIQGSNRYAGRKLVGNKETKIEFEEKPEKKETEKEKLQRELKEAIEKENYEEAAKIRDKIKELKEE